MTTPIAWLRANGVDTAPLTGTDRRVVEAVAALWEVYAFTQSPNILRAIALTLGSMQPKCVPLTQKLIARAMDWPDVDRLWPIVSAVLAEGKVRK